MAIDTKHTKHRVKLEESGLSVPVGSRVMHLFDDPAGRTRFAPFIAEGLTEGDKCVIVTDQTGAELFRTALASLGIDVARHEQTGALVVLVEEIAVESIETVALGVLADGMDRFRFMRCVNDTGYMTERGWDTRELLRFEVKGHLLVQQAPCTVICQYQSSAIERWRMDQILAAHQYTVSRRSVEKNVDRRPLSQVLFEGMDEQLRVLTRLQDLSLKLTSSMGDERTLDTIIEAAMTICRADYAAVSYLDQESGELKLIRHRGLSDEYLKMRRMTRFDSLIAPIIETARASIIEDLDSIGGSSDNYQALKRLGICSIVTMPLVAEGKVFGVIGTASRETHRYTQTEIDAMAILAAQASAAITNTRLFEQLSEANRAKDEFLATLSHELRTPLTPILGWMHILRQFGFSDPLLAQGLETVERNARQQAGMINDLLDLTRIISGKVELVKEPTNLAALVQLAVEQIRPQAHERGIAIEANLESRPLIASVDPARTQQVLGNLLSNAMKFTPAGGRVAVSLTRSSSKGGAIIEVHDTGIGIEPSFLPHVFERFSQGHVGINRQFGGLGLGLAITRAIVELHGGRVSASSEGPGEGATFTVHLPDAVIDPGLEESVLHPGVQPLDLENLGLRVLLIEDSIDTIDMLRLWLESYNCEVLAATSSVDAIRIAGRVRPDLVISDIGLPGTDGYELLKDLRSIEGLEHIPAIALTGYARQEDRELARASGYDAHIAKPAEMLHLLYVIRKLTRR